MPTTALAAIAEVAIGLAGFSGIAVVLSRRGRRLTPVDRFRLVLLLTPTLATSFLALIALGLLQAEVGGATRIAAGLLAAFCFGFPLMRVRPVVRFHRIAPELFNWTLVWSLLVGYVLVGAASALHALGVLGAGAVVLSLGLLYPLFQGAVQFGRMIFIRPRADSLADEEEQPIARRRARSRSAA